MQVNLIVATGGTLWQSFAWIEHCFQKTFRHLAQKYPGDPSIYEPSQDQLRDMSLSGRALDDNLAFILGPNKPDLLAEAHNYYRKVHDTPEGLAAVQLYPDVSYMLTDLKNAHVNLYAASEKATGAMEASLNHLGIRHFFTHVQGAETGGSSKGMVLQHLEEAVVAQRLPHLSADNALLLEGRPRGVAQALREQGYLSIGALWGGARPTQMKAAGAAWLAEEASDVFLHVSWACMRPGEQKSFRLSPYRPARDPV